MPEEQEHKSPEVVTHQGDKFVRIDPEDIDLNSMTEVQKVTDVIAGQVIKGDVKVVTKRGNKVETINHAKVGDWVVYNTGSSNLLTIPDKLLASEKKTISKTNFPYLYRADGEILSISPEDIIRLTQDIILDNIDNAEFSDTTFLHNLRKYKYVGKSVYAYHVPFNFVIRAPWGSDQFIKRGGHLIYDPNISDSENKEIYGIEGAHDRLPGEFEKTFALTPGGKTKNKQIIADTFKLAIRCDRSPIAGIQYNNRDLAFAYERAHKKMPHFLEKFLK